MGRPSLLSDSLVTLALRAISQEGTLISRFVATRQRASPPPRSGSAASGRGFRRQCASIFKKMDVSRRRSADTLRGYVRDAEIFKDRAGVGLLNDGSVRYTPGHRWCIKAP
jgi:hypothetical protein